MTSIRELLTEHPSLLLIDAASTVLHLGLTRPGIAPVWLHREGEASSTLFALLAESGASPNDFDGFVFCEGPGSMLGIRTVATALRTWVALRPRPIWSYRSLDLPASSRGTVGDAFICDARRQSWHVLTLADETASATPLRRLKTEQLAHTFMPAGFRTWTPLPDPAPTVVPYEPSELTGALIDAPLLRANPEPDAYQDTAPDYVRWTPQVHRAPEASR
ncbi:peptidase M22 [Actomonas aquatica]|uniref:Peptidase M22 n=1 Tax=Actomonas aquatica TaxID=2866162 RepID=A0ABZ1CC69_9BACT|nr:peptidase M22 [Opitutus sp. WL0086]WRQ88985.1 peptidase M22 [Opitutus sp. WL0086]